MNYKSSARVSLFLVLVCVGLTAGTNAKNELKKISQFLAQHNVAPEDPVESLKLIESNKAGLDGIVVHTILSLNDASDCNGGKSVARVSKYLSKTEDDLVRNLLRHSAKEYFSRCWSEYETKMAESFSDMSEKQQNKMLSILSDDVITNNHNANANIVEDILPPREPGSLFNHSLPYILDSVKDQLPVENFDAKKIKHLFAAGKIVAKLLGKSCPSFYLNTRPVVTEMRQLIAIVDPEESTKLGNLSASFRANLFRYKFCEDISRIRSSTRLMKVMKTSLKQRGVKIDETSVQITRSKRDLILGAIIAGVVILLCVLFYGLTWLLYPKRVVGGL